MPGMARNRNVKFQAVIFDCDGVLVDSETLACRVLVEYVAELGLTLALEEAIALFKGRKMAESVVDVEQRLGRAVPDGFVPNFRARCAEAFQTHLKPIPGVEIVLRTLSVPFCVASSGPREKMELTLGITGLRAYFENRIFSAYEVGSWKPDPGLFLHAAQALNIRPRVCAVVEDSLPGVQAGVAAGMTVFGYAASTAAAPLIAAGASVFHDMAQLLDLLLTDVH